MPVFRHPTQPLTIRALRKLPPFFSLKYLRDHDYEDVDAVVQRYYQEGLLDRLGDGVFHNVIAGSYDIFRVIRSVIKLPLYGGISCLHDYGVITQIPQKLSLYVIDQPNATQLDTVDYIHRDMGWFEDMLSKNAILHTQGHPQHKSRHPIPTLHPQYVHLDMLEHAETHGLDPDDFDWDFMDMDGDIAFMFEPPEPESTFDSVMR